MAAQSARLSQWQGAGLSAPAGQKLLSSRDVADAMSFIVPGVAQVFLGSAVIGEYLPQTPKDEAFAAQGNGLCQLSRAAGVQTVMPC